MKGRAKDLSLPQETVTLEVRTLEPARLDLYVGANLPWRSRTHLQALIRKGKVLVNGQRAKPSTRVRSGDRITVRIHETAEIPDYERFTLEYVYEDPWLLAVNKPPGLLVHPVGDHVYDTLINHLHFRHRNEQDEEGEPVRPRLCHRIDRETTGIVLVGLDSWVHDRVRHQFENRLVSKEYVALARGDYAGGDSIDVPMGEGHDLPSSLHHRHLRPARTTVRVLERFEGYTLLACRPATGRQNQIRIHLGSVGHPIVGDERFGDGPPPDGFPARYLLHSRAIRLEHPRLKSTLDLSAELPEDFQALIGTLRV
jgi:23S rRNA pseudouridine1911/1915/1917 synthase